MSLRFVVLSPWVSRLGWGSLDPVHKEVLELSEISEFILVGVRDLISNCLVIVNDFDMVRLGECSKNPDDVLIILLQFISSVQEDKGECFCIFGKNNLPITWVSDCSSSNWWSKFELNFPNLLHVTFADWGGMQGGENMVKLHRFTSNDVIPVLRWIYGTVRFGLDGCLSILWLSSEICKDFSGLFKRLWESDCGGCAIEPG